jgi:hypothetical protein
MGFLKRQNNGKIDRMDFASDHESVTRAQLLELFKNIPLPDNQKLENLGLYLNSKHLSRILFLKEFYKFSIDAPGQIFDFGTRWGQNMAVFIALRDMFEPYNRSRVIVGFDTFQGFPSIHKKDGPSELNQVGNLETAANYEEYLFSLLTTLERDTALSHLTRFALIKGDVCETLPSYLKNNPHTIVSHAFFDLDLYEPTFQSLKLIWPRAPKGAIFAFDELNDPDSPGETLALMEAVGISNINLKRLPHVSRISYFIKE